MTTIALIKRYWQFAVIAAVCGYVALLKVDLADTEVELSFVKQMRAEDNAIANSTARIYTDQLRVKENKHAQDQQALETKFAADRTTWQARRSADAADAARMRGTIAQYAEAGRRRAGETDASAYQRAADRLNVVAGLLAEGRDLVAEGRGVVEGRDREVIRLLDQIRLDRGACSAK